MWRECHDNWIIAPHRAFDQLLDVSTLSPALHAGYVTATTMAHACAPDTCTRQIAPPVCFNSRSATPASMPSAATAILQLKHQGVHQAHFVASCIESLA